MSKLTIWLTPMWVLSVGLTIGAAILLLLWGICWIVNRRLALSIADAVSKGILRPISYLLAAVAAFAILAGPVMPVSRMMASLQRLGKARTIETTVTIPAHKADFEIPATFRASEILEYEITSDVKGVTKDAKPLAVNVAPDKGYVSPLLLVFGGEPYRWSPGADAPRVFEGEVSKLYVSNDNDAESTVAVRIVADVEMPQVHVLPMAAASVVGLYLTYLLIRWLAPRASVIAAATAKETISQPTFILLMVVGAVALVIFVFVPYNTLGEDVKMVKTTGLTTIKILAIIMALWTASTSIADEIEGRTALTVLSKPVGRLQFIVGKFLGIVWPIVLMFVVLGLVFLFCVSFKVVYDARESAKVTPEWTECYTEVVRIVPGLVLAFLETIILAAISVAVSTRLPMLPNLVICGSIYTLGHLASLIVRSSAGDIVFVRFVGRLLSVILPVLDHFEIEGAIAGASVTPMAYLGWALAYSLLYCAAAMLLALIFFESRDLA